MQYLHVSKESPSIKSHMVEKSNKLAKINEMSEFMKSLWKKSFNLGQNIVIDESMFSFDRRVAFKQYMPKRQLNRESDHFVLLTHLLDIYMIWYLS